MKNSFIPMIAFRNLGRHKIKTVLTVTAIALAVLFYIFLDGWMEGVKVQSVQNIYNYETAADQIMTGGFFEKKKDLPLYQSFRPDPEIFKILNTHGYAVTPRALFKGNLLVDGNEFPLVCAGFDPATYHSVFFTGNYITEGAFTKSGEMGITIGSYTARDLGVKTGDAVVLSATIDVLDEDGKERNVNQAISLVVTGIFKTPNPQINSGWGFIPLDILQDEMGMMLDGRITDLSIRKAGSRSSDRITAMEHPDTIRKVIGSKLPADLILIDFQDTVKEAMALAESNALFYNLLIIFIIILALIGITNTIYIALLQRKTEMGMLRAIGMNDRQMMFLYVYEAGFIGLFGAVLGLIGGAFVNYLMVEYGINMSAMMEDSSVGSFRIYEFKSVWKPESFMLAFGASFLVCAMIAVIPTFNALKTSIVDALYRE